MSEKSTVVVEVCPETGICSIVKGSGEKVDLMPDEVTQLRNAGDSEAAKSILAEIDPNFAEALDSATVAKIREHVK